MFVAPADYHLLVEDGGSLALSTEGPVRSARPSIDVLFETAAEAYGPALIGVLLTGASADGAAGLAQRQGARRPGDRPGSGHGRVRDDAGAGIAAAPVDYILPLERIGDHLVSLVEGTRA